MDVSTTEASVGIAASLALVSNVYFAGIVLTSGLKLHRHQENLLLATPKNLF